MIPTLQRMRIGLGHDTHRLAAGGPLVLGGLTIPHAYHSVGHSDADVLLHAITDALLGAANAGDIGQRFPNSDPENQNRDSGQMLELAWQPLATQGWTLLNMDCVVFAQQPKLLPYWPPMSVRIAELLSSDDQEIRADQISLKAKTGESVGPIGRGEAISAQCNVLLLAPEN